MKGWYGNRYSHSLASRGIRSKVNEEVKYKKYKFYHGTSLYDYEKILNEGYIKYPFITSEYLDADMWSKKSTNMRDFIEKNNNNLPIILEMEIPRDFLENKCVIDPLLLDERYFGFYEKYDDLVATIGKEASEWWMSELEKKGIDWVDWTIENINSFECDNIPTEWIKNVYIMRDYNKGLERGNWGEY